MTQSNQTANCFARKWISRIFRIFRPENCKQRRMGESVKSLKQDLEKAREL